TQYDLAGRVEQMKDALNATTTYAYFYPRSNDPATAAAHSQLYPNGSGTITQIMDALSGTQTTETYLDGGTKAVVGSATTPAKMDKGAWEENGKSGTWSKTIRIGEDQNGDPTETEYTINYNDFAGRSSKIVGADGATSTSFYNAKNQLVRSVDPDGVTSLFAYDMRGRRFRQAVDMNDTGDIEENSPDHISETAYDVISYQGAVVNRTRNYLFAQTAPAAKTLVSTNLRDGYGNQNWQIDIYGNESSSILSRTGNGNWTQVRSSDDGSQQKSSYTNGRMSASQQLDDSGNILESQSMTYDAHGRVATQTHSRTGTTSFTYSDRDEVLTQTAPDPDGATGPLSSLRTEFSYDALGRQIKTIQPDLSEQYLAYSPRGEVIKSWGADQVPTEMEYDLQGRMRKLITWQDFDQLNGVGVSGKAETKWAYHPQSGQMSSKTYEGGLQTLQYTYTPGRRLATRTNARGIETRYAYNLAGELLAVDYQDADLTPDILYSYTRFGGKDLVSDGQFDNQAPITAGAFFSTPPGLQTTRYRHDYGYSTGLNPMQL
ncbi:MAG: hypothetical protein AAF840_15330, partial [Bacteroidota bacterium]